MSDSLDHVRAFMARASGDEKHDASVRSTLEVLWMLYDRVLRYDPADPHSPARDRFLLSKGHGPVGLYAILAAKGFFAPDALSDFAHQRGFLGHHPDRLLVPGIEISTGSLGHGLPLAVGTALGLRAKGSDRRVFVLIGDGESNEGSVWEAVILAANLGLTNLTCILINNHSSSIQVRDPVAPFAAFGWDAVHAATSNQDALYAALSTQHPQRPRAVMVDVGARGA
ncbi:MAG: transketolase [Oscillochloris sp.]|nr:transketolase [Oscillochloris sp.]